MPIKQKTHNGVGQKLEIQKAKKDLEIEIVECERAYRNMLDTFLSLNPQSVKNIMGK